MSEKKSQAEKEQEWADKIQEDAEDEYEPTYRDGSAVNECWKHAGDA